MKKIKPVGEVKEAGDEGAKWGMGWWCKSLGGKNWYKFFDPENKYPREDLIKWLKKDAIICGYGDDDEKRSA